ncbi:MAG TPA: hypothetical protein VFS31_03185, partial [Chitinophagaceae bacterium]|nr:hypothetical protein [Chitinophagaceae bacterium]
MATLQNGPLGTGLPYRQIAFTLLEQEVISGFSKDQRPSQPFILDLVTLEKLFFQSIPSSINIEPDSSFVAVESPGRNNP